MKNFFYVLTILVIGIHKIFAYDPSPQDTPSVPDSIPSQTQDALDQYSQSSKNATQMVDTPASDEKNLSPEEQQFASRLTPQNRQLFVGFSSDQRQLAMQVASKLQNAKNPITPDMAVESVKKYSDQAVDLNNANSSEEMEESSSMQSDPSNSSK